MGHNGQPPINISDFHRKHVVMSRDRVAQLVCPGCGEWRRVRRHMIEPHTCVGGGQRIWVDVDVEAIERHYRRYRDARDASRVRTPDGKPRHNNPYEKATPRPPLPGDVNPTPPVNARGEQLLPACTRL